MSAVLEHANITVANPSATAAWMEQIFGWHIRWQGDAKDGGYSIHVGSKDSYLALYSPGSALNDASHSYTSRGGLNHLAVVVDNYEDTERQVRAAGFKVGEHYDYEPGRRFYFYDDNGIEYEVVNYD